MRILLLGANGQVGHELRRALGPLGDLVCTTRSGRLDGGEACEPADFDHPVALGALVGRIAPDVVVNAAAYTAVDRAESEPEAAFRVNAEAPATLAAACAARDALLVHYSTDYVFDGRAGRPYREDDPVAPLNVYGRSKLAGEEAVRASGARHMIFRTAWVYSGRGHNFMRTMLRLAGEREELRIVADQTGAPTAAHLIAAATVHALRGPRRSGLWHLAASGATTWHGFARAILAHAQSRGLVDRVPVLLPIASRDYPAAARRPRSSLLDTGRLHRDFGVELPPWDQVLPGVLDQLARRS